MKAYLDAAAILTMSVACVILAEPPLGLIIGSIGAATGCFALIQAIRGRP